MKKLFTIGSVLAAAAAFAAPTISGTSVSIDAVTRNLKIAYTLSEKAVVTADFRVGGASIGATNFLNAVGDLNRTVEAGVRAIYWRPHQDWPGHVEDVTVRLTAWPEDNPPDYLVADLIHEKEIRYYATIDAIPFGHTNRLYKTDKLIMRKIPARGVKWRMGGGTETGNNYSDWRSYEAHHWMTIPHNYYMAIYETTAWQKKRVMKSAIDPADETLLLPVVEVYHSNVRGWAKNGISWPDSGDAVGSETPLAAFRAQTGLQVDLPTEAEWEFACRAGTKTAFNNGENLSGLWNGSPAGICWDSGNAGNVLHEVGLLQPNAWHLYDMHGNVCEWCRDWRQADFYAADSESVDVGGPTTGTYRIYRGGGIGLSACCARSAYRAGGRRPEEYSTDKVGYRLTCPAVAK